MTNRTTSLGLGGREVKDFSCFVRGRVGLSMVNHGEFGKDIGLGSLCSKFNNLDTQSAISISSRGGCPRRAATR